MMGGRLMLRRVKRLEQMAYDERVRRLDTLTDDELDAWVRASPPVDPALEAALAELSDAELEWLRCTSTTDMDVGRRLCWLQRRRL